jgi:phosphate:Na+ symporter
LSEIFTFITNIEHAGDVIDHSILKQATKRIKRGVMFSPKSLDGISEMSPAMAAVIERPKECARQ